MNFLVNAFCSDVDGVLLGATIVSFDPTNYQSRAGYRAYTEQELKQDIGSMNPCGFMLSDDGLLYADSNARRTIGPDTFSFVYDQCQRVVEKKKDITDLILYGVQHGGSTLINYSEVKEGAEPIMVPLSSYRVSASSMNIYAPYRVPDGTFRTHSMLEVEDGSGKTVYVIFPDGKPDSSFNGFCTDIDHLMINDASWTVYKVDTTLASYNVTVGEAFLNYLAYMVAYYNIGRQVLKALAPEVKVGYDKPEAIRPERQVREVKRNISIIHQYTREYVDDVIACGDDVNKLSNLITAIPEANVTLNWVHKVFSSPWYNRELEDAGMSTVSSNLLVECREQGLKMGLELLTHRNQLLVVSSFDNSLPLILSGGGVSGQSAKRVSL